MDAADTEIVRLTPVAIERIRAVALLEDVSPSNTFPATVAV